MLRGHHVAPRLVLEVKVKLHAIAQAAHGVQVEELLKVIVGGRVHAVVMVVDLVVVPCCRVHHGQNKLKVGGGGGRADHAAPRGALRRIHTDSW